MNFPIVPFFLILAFLLVNDESLATSGSRQVAVLERVHKEQCLIERGVNQTLLRCNQFKPIARMLADIPYPEFLFAHCPGNSKEEGHCFFIKSPDLEDQVEQGFLDKLWSDMVSAPRDQFYFFWTHSRDDILEDGIALGLPLLASYWLLAHSYPLTWVVTVGVVGYLIMRPLGVYLGNWARSESDSSENAVAQYGNSSSGVVVELASFSAGSMTKLAYIAVEFKEVWAYKIYQSLHPQFQQAMRHAGGKLSGAIVMVGKNLVGLNRGLAGGNIGMDEIDGGVSDSARRGVELLILGLLLLKDVYSLIDDYNWIDDRADSAREAVRGLLEGYEE